MKEKTVTCPQCGSQRNYKNGICYNHRRNRYLCRDYAYKFTPKT